jgi:hypothetical protein
VNTMNPPTDVRELIRRWYLTELAGA